MDLDAAKELLQCSRRGVLAVNGDDGYPYAVPVNYFYDRNAGKYIFMEHVPDTKLMPCAPVTKYASPFTEMKP